MAKPSSYYVHSRPSTELHGYLRELYHFFTEFGCAAELTPASTDSCVSGHAGAGNKLCTGGRPTRMAKADAAQLITALISTRFWSEVRSNRVHVLSAGLYWGARSKRDG